MTPILWLFCLAVLWTGAVNTQVDAVQPLVMAVYIQQYEPEKVARMDPKAKPYFIRRVILTDAEKENIDNLKLPLGDTEPTYIALLCGDSKEDSEEHKFTVKQVVDKIDLIDRNTRCEYYVQPYMRDATNTHTGEQFLTFGFVEAVETLKPLRKFANAFDIKSQVSNPTREYLQLEYNFYSNAPKTIKHKVVAHMHSITYEKECENIYVPKESVDGEERTYEDLVATFKSKQAPDNHQWRQLVPMQDFKGIYTTQVTCIYLNYLQLHEKTISSLEDIEISIRMVADVINEVTVVTNTYYSRENYPSFPKIDVNINTTPTIVWKKISYFQDGKEYAIAAIIHNKETERICNEKISWGWPDGNENESEIGIGVMYYCSINNDLLHKLQVHMPRIPSPFNLREVPYQDEKIDILKRILNISSSLKTETESKRNRISNWLSWIKQSLSSQ